MAAAVTRSVFARQEQSGAGAVGFRYDPDHRASAQFVGREQPETVRQRKLVFFSIFCRQVSPIAVSVPAKEIAGAFA